MRRSILARFMLAFLLGALPYLPTDFIRTTAHGSNREGASDKTIDNLIADLGSNRFEIREAATDALKQRVEAIPALRKTRQSADLEVRRRVQVILTALERKRAEKGLSKSRALGKAGRAVEVADRLAIAAKYGIAGDEGWESLTQLANRLITRTDPYFPAAWKFHRNREFPGGEFRRFVKLVNPREIAEPQFKLDTGNKPDAPENPQWVAGRKLLNETHGKLLIRGDEISLTGLAFRVGLCNGMIAASGEVQITGAIGSVIVSGGDVKKIESLNDCIIICDGDVELLSGWNVSGLIIARGNVICKAGQIRNCLVRSGHTLGLPNGNGFEPRKTIDLRDGTPDPVAFVKFFELADVGLAAEDLPRREKVNAGGVRLKEVRKDSPFATGLRAGDVITAIEEKETRTSEIFRKVLRRKLAEGGPTISFTVKRSGKTSEVPIALKD